MKKDGLQRMLDFLNMLSDKNIHFYLEQHAEDYLTATITLVGIRVEVMFSVDDMTFSVFPGKEDVLMDEKLLHELIRQHVDG